MKAHQGLLVVLLCVGSLADVPWVRTAEQSLAPALLVGQLLLAGLMPPARVVGELPPEVSDQDAVAAELAWASWLDAVARRPPPRVPDRDLCVVPVLSCDSSHRELILRVPCEDLLVDSPVTHRGVLVGFLRPWSRHDERVVVDGRARVALLGHPQARAVAATWEDESWRFLVASRKLAPTVTLRSRRIRPRPGQLALSRDASELGDSLPAGLALGRVALRETDLPGGALALQIRDEPALDPLLPAESLSLVAVEAPRGSGQICPSLSGRLLPSARDGRRWHLDQGQLDGVDAGDEVIQGHRWVGRIEWVGPLTAVVSRDLPLGSLLVADEAQQLIPVGPGAGAWPEDWQPRAGLPVFCGLPGWGGLTVGRLGPVQRERLTVDFCDFDPSQPVTVLKR